MASEKSQAQAPIGIIGLLGVLFVALKLTGYISWSWWWVTMPFWGGLAAVLVIGGLALAVMAAFAAWGARKK